MHDYGLVPVSYARVGDVIGPNVHARYVRFVVLCRTCGMRPDGSGQVISPNVMRRSSCTQ